MGRSRETSWQYCRNQICLEYETIINNIKSLLRCIQGTCFDNGILNIFLTNVCKYETNKFFYVMSFYSITHLCF